MTSSIAFWKLINWFVPLMPGELPNQGEELSDIWRAYSLLVSAMPCT